MSIGVSVSTTIQFVHADDWEGLYIDGKLILEGHSLSAVDVLDAIWEHRTPGFGLRVTSYEAHDADEDWMFTQGTLPVDFEDVKVDDA